MILLALARLADWETDSYTGYISSISTYGQWVTYGTYFSSFINNTDTGTSDILYEGENINSVLVAVYKDVQATYYKSDNKIVIYQNFTSIIENTDSDTETIWQEAGCELKNANAKELFLYEDMVAYINNNNVLIYKLQRAVNAYGENIASAEAKQIGSYNKNNWQFMSVNVSGTMKPFVIITQTEGEEQVLYVVNYTTTARTIKLEIPEIVGKKDFQLLRANSSDTDNLLMIKLADDTVMTFQVTYDDVAEKPGFVVTLLQTIDVVHEILPKIELADIASYYGQKLYVIEHVLLFGTSYLCVYPLIADSTIYYESTGLDVDEFTILLVRAYDKDMFALTVDAAPAYLYSDSYNTIYLMGSQDNTQSGYFSVDLNFLLPAYPTEQMSCWLNKNKVKVNFDEGNGIITAQLLNIENCDSKTPQGASFCDLAGCTSMSLVSVIEEDEDPIYIFKATIAYSALSTFDFQVYGAVGQDASGKLVSKQKVGFVLDSSQQSCWLDTDTYDGSLSYNYLKVTIDKGSADCIYDNPIIQVEGETFLKEKVELRQMTTVSPQDAPVYIYFFDPGDETFAGDVEFIFFIEQISPAGVPIGSVIEKKYTFETDMDSCWNYPQFLGMSYNGDHFELLLTNRFWETRNTPVCDPRIDSMPELEVDFSYKTSGKKKSPTLTEKDFKILENGRWAYFVDFDVYSDYVSSKVHINTDEKVTPYVGDDFELDGDYPIEFSEPDSCFEFMELISIEYDGDNHAYVTVDEQFWCKNDQVSSDYHVEIIAVSQGPDEDGDYSYCDMIWDAKNTRYYNNDCELDMGLESNYTVLEFKTFVNSDDDWDEDDFIVNEITLIVIDSRYNYTYIILISVFGSVLIISAIVFTIYWYFRKFLPNTNSDAPFRDDTKFMPVAADDAPLASDTVAGKSSHKKSFFGPKKTHEKAFDEELFSSIPAPPMKK